MFATILEMVLMMLVASVKNPANVTQTEWTILEEMGTAIAALVAKKPSTMN